MKTTGRAYLYISTPPALQPQASPGPEGETTELNEINWTCESLSSWLLDVSKGQLQFDWYTWVGENEEDGPVYGGGLQVWIEGPLGKAYALGPMFKTRKLAVDAVARRAVGQQGLDKLVMDRYASYVEPGPPVLPLEPPTDLVSFTASLNLPPRQEKIAKKAIVWINDVASHSGLSVEAAIIRPDPESKSSPQRFGVIITVADTYAPDPTAQLSWIVPKIFKSGADALKAGCQVALKCGFLKVIPNPVVLLPSTLRLPYNESKPPWERTEAVTTCTTLRTIELNLLGPKGQALDDASRELGIGWTDWCFVVEEDSEEPDVSASPEGVTALLHVGAAGMIACFSLTGRADDSLRTTTENLASVALAELERTPSFFADNSLVGDKVCERPEYVRGPLTSIPATSWGVLTWAQKFSLCAIFANPDSLLNGSLLDIGIYQGQIHPVAAVEMLAGQRLAKILLTDTTDGKTPSTHGCRLELWYPGLRDEYLSYSVPCVFQSVAGARITVCNQAIYCCYLERALTELLPKFIALEGNAAKDAHIDEQEAHIRRECLIRQRGKLIFEEFNNATTFSCVLILDLGEGNQLRYPAQFFYKSAREARREAILAARMGGVLEAIASHPTQYGRNAESRNALELKARGAGGGAEAQAYPV